MLQDNRTVAEAHKAYAVLNRHLEEEPECTHSLREIVADILGSETPEK